MLQFEILKARHHSIPEVYIEGYLDLKCSSKTFLGILKIMRLTGEGPPFDANTECNIAFAHTKLKIPIGTAQLYAGDDCAFDFAPEDKPSFKKIEKLGQPRIKAGQTIASFQQEAVMLYGTMARYMRRVREVFQPKNIIINCEKTPEELSKWAAENWNFNRRTLMGYVH